MRDRGTSNGSAGGDQHVPEGPGTDTPGIIVDTRTVASLALELSALADRLDAALESHGASFDVIPAARDEVSHRVASAYTAAGAQTTEAITSGSAVLRALSAAMSSGAGVFDSVEAENVGQLRGVRW